MGFVCLYMYVPCAWNLCVDQKMALEFLELELEPVVIHLAVLGSKLQTSATTEPTLGPTAHDFLSTKPIKNKYEKIKNNLVIFIY